MWLVPLVLALLVGGVGWWADLRLRQTIQQELQGNLQTTLNANVTSLEIWMENQKRIAAALTQEPRFKTLALELLERSNGGDTNRVTTAELSRKLISEENLQVRLSTLGYTNAQLVATNLTIVTETGDRRNRRGTPVLEELQLKYAELFATGEPILITPFKVTSPPFQRPFNRGGERRAARAGDGPRVRPTNGIAGRRDLTVMQVAAPIKDNLEQTRGALALIINPDKEFTKILSVARSGDSGETFAFDSEGGMISESRFDDQLRQLKLIKDEPGAVSALTLALRDPGGDLTEGFKPPTNSVQPLIEMVANAIEGGAGVEINPFRDYRGVPVVGAWQWLPKYQFGVGTKIDVREAYRPLRVVRSIFAILFLLLVLVSLVVLVFSYLQVVWRRRLTEAELKARQLGQYKISGKIGEGAMGVVYKAQHALLRRETALKLLLPEKADAASVTRFEQEVRLTCRLTHPNTIQVYDYGHTPDGIFYYAMEFLDGLNLHELVHRYGAQPEERVIYILQQICESLNEAHNLGLIHRDVKPANVFLCDRGGVPDCLKVLDFGLVKRFGGAAKHEEQAEAVREIELVGTPNYIAPEAIKDSNQVDARSDLYSVGALGYYLLTGREVFEGSSIAELCGKHLSEKPVPPGVRVGKTFDPKLEAVLLSCLEKDPVARPQTARELADRLSGCALARQWTPERRAAWWIEHRKSLIGLPKPVLPEVATLDKTVKIEFAERTP